MSPSRKVDSAMLPSFKERILSLDRQLIERAKPINVLKHLNWPDEIEETFLSNWQAGDPRLPEVEICVPDWSEAIAALDDLQKQAEGNDPLLQYLASSAWS